MSGILRAFTLFTGASVVGTITQIVKGKLSAVFLGAAGVGVLNQLTSVWSLFAVIAGLGFYNGMVRHMAQRWDANDRHSMQVHLSSSMFLLSVVALATALLGCVYSEAVSAFVFDDDGQRGDLVCLILVSVPVYIVSQVYRAMLNATRLVSWLVRARIAADVLSVLVLAVLIVPFGLKGAIASYIGLHVLYLTFTAIFTAKSIGREYLVPRYSMFRWSEIKINTGYGINGLIAVAIGIVTTIIVSRWIISSLDLAANGIYTMALKVATVYLGGLSAAAGGYYFPTLSAAKSDAEMHCHVNETLSHYMYLIPPIIVLLATFSDILIRVLFTAEFLPATLLLLFMLPGDLFRISAETVGLPLVVKRRFVFSTGLYLVWAVTYLCLASWLLPARGVAGVAMAYLISQAINATLVLVIAGLVLGYRMSLACILSLLRGIALVALVAIFLWLQEDKVIGYFFCLAMLVVWVLFSLQDPVFKRILVRLQEKFLSRQLL
jgi:O-antigen/teichoic acid export membrane protein